jgi:class 3 adenylate cyclase/CheY-like chemotaxis protein
MMDTRYTVLIVDDIPKNISTLAGILGDEYRVNVAVDGETALQSIATDPPDLVLLDIMMSDMGGYDVFQTLKKDENTRDTPIIFITSIGETEYEVKGFELGAVDYITEPIDPSIILSRIKTHLELKVARDILRYQNQMLLEKEKKRTEELVELNRTLERFIPKQFIELLGKKSIQEVNLGDQIFKKMTVLFADIRGWTTLCENMTPEENFHFINAYLKRVSPIIRKYNGFIDQYIGDGLMAIFPGTVDEAVAAAVAMHKAVEEYNYNRELLKKSLRPISIGIGINTGDIMLGIIGFRDRMQGAVISDVVNLAARMEGLTRIYGSSITLNESTLSELDDPNQYNYRFMDLVLVKGTQEPVSIYEIFDSDPDDVIELKSETKPDFEKGILLYYEKNFAESRAHFHRVLQKNPQDKAAQIFLERCSGFLEKGVPKDWSGIADLNRIFPI